MEKNPNMEPDITSSKEDSQNVDLTMEEIEAERAQKATCNTDITDAEIKASVDGVNPDEGSMDSRG